MVLVYYLLQGDACPAQVCILFQQLMILYNTVNLLLNDSLGNGVPYINLSFSMVSGYTKLYQYITQLLIKLNVYEVYGPLRCNTGQLRKAKHFV
jgi:hypothetical protein